MFLNINEGIYEKESYSFDDVRIWCSGLQQEIMKILYEGRL